MVKIGNNFFVVRGQNMTWRLLKKKLNHIFFLANEYKCTQFATIVTSSHMLVQNWCTNRKCRNYSTLLCKAAFWSERYLEIANFTLKSSRKYCVIIRLLHTRLFNFNDLQLQLHKEQFVQMHTWCHNFSYFDL